MALNTSNSTSTEVWLEDGGLGETGGGGGTPSHLQCYILLGENRTDLDVEACHAANSAAQGSTTSAAIVFGLAIILANLPVLLGIARKRSLHKPMYYLIANMAGVDAMAGVMCLVVPAVRGAGGGEGTYLILYTTFFFSVLLSLTGLMLLTLDRYVSIYHGLFHQTNITGKHVAGAVFTTWVLSALVSYSPLLGWTCDTNSLSDMCIDSLDLNYFICLVVIILAGMVFVVVINVRIYVTLKRRLVAVGANMHAHLLGGVHMSAQQVKAAKKKATTVCFLACACIISWTPYVIAMVQLLDGLYMRSVEERLAYKPTVFGVAVVFLGIFPVLNPVVYAFRLPQLRTAFKKMFQDCHRWVWIRRCGRAANNQVAPLGNVVVNVHTTDTLPSVDVH
ncbi:lysophosphatidic acid receptor 3-like [Branchiostoma lanceolatum]|uniref:lysophosphatidic acid receptor 3-like n=1 Tax=Branchiostoma lanceolatum TaxID=7740 RepID=UPI0034564870